MQITKIREVKLKESFNGASNNLKWLRVHFARLFQANGVYDDPSPGMNKTGNHDLHTQKVVKYSSSGVRTKDQTKV